jgi:hypothetical protein
MKHATRRRWLRLGTASTGMGGIRIGGIGRGGIRMGGIGVAVLLGASALGGTVLAPGAGAQVAWVQATETAATHYGYGPGPKEPACAGGQLRLVLRLPHANYYGGSPVPFRVQIINLTSQPCSVTALQPPSGLTTELVYVRILDSHGRRVLIPGGPPGLRVRMLPTALAAHQVFSYTCTWTGRVWTGTGVGQPPGLGGVPAPSGRYTAVAVLANPAVQTGPLHFVLKAR